MRWLPTVLCLVIFGNTQAQSDPAGNYRDFPIMITLQFNALSMPFRDITFANPGIGLGTELRLNGPCTAVQQFQLIWYRNRNTGNGITLQTQSVWRPTMGKNGFGELKLGLGYLISRRPSEAFESKGGTWISRGRKGKGMLTIPLAVGAGWVQDGDRYSTATFAGYQFMLLNNYSKSIPLVPATFVQAGVRIHQ